MLFAGHIQLAERDTDLSPFFNGAQIIFVNASPIEFLDPADELINAVVGECPIEVAIPKFDS